MYKPSHTPVGERFRLPNTIIPKCYRLTLEPNFSNFTFVGSVGIDITVRERTDIVVLHASDIGTTAASIKNSRG